MSENFSHQVGIFDPRTARRVTIIGVGSIGSVVTLVLAKMGVTDITVFDHDSVASHNAPMSLYRGMDTGRLKVEALKETILGWTGVEIKGVPEAYTNQPLRSTTVVACVDTMSARSAVWRAVKNAFSVDLLIDTRTAEAYAEVYAVAPRRRKDGEDYEASLFPDTRATPQTCGRHGVSFVSMGVAATVGATLSRFWQTGQKQWCHSVKYDTLEQLNN